VPTILTAALNVPVAGADISSLKRASGGGSAIPVAVGKGLEKLLGVPVLEVYGMTETSRRCTSISYDRRPIRLGSVGHAVPYSKVRVVKIDANGRVARLRDERDRHRRDERARRLLGLSQRIAQPRRVSSSRAGVNSGRLGGGSTRTATCGSPAGRRT
jgi:acyl-CoA synthetase (AMP-forming)/AMP-acid ligase II